MRSVLQKKFLVPADLTIGQFMYVIRKVRVCADLRRVGTRRERERRALFCLAVPDPRRPSPPPARTISLEA